MGELRLLVSADSRLKREDYHRTRHDSSFSKWKIIFFQVLVGSSDWKDYYLGKEGAIKYRIHNLPLNGIPGLYELGIASSESDLHSDSILVVYLGQADDVRSRLQHYGRSGAHLHTKCSCDGGCKVISYATCEQCSSGMFDEVFERGFSIVFRWARMENKMTAERTEAKLLDTFDYAWNKGANGSRRPEDILVKINKFSTGLKPQSLSEKILRLGSGAVGVKIVANEDDKGFLPAILKSLSTPFSQKVQTNVIMRSNATCGMVVGENSPCRKLAVPGRKRCGEHKGMRMCKSVLKKEQDIDLSEKISCGVRLGNGKVCANPAVKESVRCIDHKGLKVNGVVSKGRCSKVLDSGEDHPYYSLKGGDEINRFEGSTVSAGLSTRCEKILSNGSNCKRKPTLGSARCWQHKLMNSDEKSSAESSSIVDYGYQASESSGITIERSIFEENLDFKSSVSSFSNSSNFNYPTRCEKILANGSNCKRKPKLGNTRCWQH